MLQTLPIDITQRLLQNGRSVKLHVGDTLCRQGLKLRHVYFPLTCFVSLMIRIDDRAPFEVAMVSSDGMVGVSILLEVSEAPMSAVVQGGGEAIKIPVHKFQEVSRDAWQLQTAAKHYLFDLLVQLGCAAVCSQFHSISHRLARRLLQTSDRSGSESFALTQQSLSEILGVQRSAISIAASELQAKQLISYSRGFVTILDRVGLEAESCSCYSVTRGRQRST